jgi:hypothetical protein
MDVLDASEHCYHIKLMSGRKLDPDYTCFSIDSQGRVYAYSDELGCYGEVRNAKAVTKNGTRIVYNAKKAFYEYVMTGEELEAFGYDPYEPIEYGTPWDDMPDEDENFPT